MQIALAHFVKFAPFVSKMNDKNFVYPVLIFFNENHKKN